MVPSLLVLCAVVGFLVYVGIRYGPIVGRIFEETPVMLPLQAEPERGEEVRFPTSHRLELAGTYYHTTASKRLGVVVFCHEFLGDRWSAGAYADGLRERGFDLFSFDFRNHGESDEEPDLKKLQWVSDREIADLRAALDYLKTRADRDPAGVALFGISRGGGAALCVAAQDPAIWGVITDGAFPTRGTMLAYILRWAEIYVHNRWLWDYLPKSVFAFAGWAGRARSGWRLGRAFPDVESAVARLAPRPWLAIHGEKDAYIGAEIIQDLFNRADEPKELWIVPGAKHNRCREVSPEHYRGRIESFMVRFAPRQNVLTVSSGDSETSGAMTRRGLLAISGAN
jgi:pimeloyl-ACP methyl ester carboxylesterase